MQIQSNLGNLFEIEIKLWDMLLKQQDVVVKTEIGDDFSIHSVHWIEMKQMESDELRTHIHTHKHTAVLHFVENTEKVAENSNTAAEWI